MSSVYVPEKLRVLVEQRAFFCCEYCQTQVAIIGMRLEVEHIQPTSAGGRTIAANLCLACPRCNRHKAARVSLVDGKTEQAVSIFNPRQQTWSEHFEWQKGGIEIAGLSPTGRVTVDALQMNNPFVARSRRIWVEKGWHPPAKLGD